jgi:hypothetical protein
VMPIIAWSTPTPASHTAAAAIAACSADGRHRALTPGSPAETSSFTAHRTLWTLRP